MRKSLFAFFAKEKSSRILFSQLQLKIGLPCNFSALPPLFSVCMLLARNKMKKKRGRGWKERKIDQKEEKKKNLYILIQDF